MNGPEAGAGLGEERNEIQRGAFAAEVVPQDYFQEQIFFPMGLGLAAPPPPTIPQYNLGVLHFDEPGIGGACGSGGSNTVVPSLGPYWGDSLHNAVDENFSEMMSQWTNHGVEGSRDEE